MTKNKTLNSKKIKCVKANIFNKKAKYYYPEEDVKETIQRIKERIDGIMVSKEDFENERWRFICKAIIDEEVGSLE